MITTSHHRQSTSQDDAYNTLTGLLYYLCNQIARKKLCLSGYQHKNKELHTRNSKTQNRPTGGGANKKFSCRRETVRCFVSLNISPSHSRSFYSTVFFNFTEQINDDDDDDDDEMRFLRKT